MGAISAACVVALAAAWLAIWIRDNRPAPHRTRDEVLGDVARLRVERLMPEIYAALATEPRKENDQ